MAMAPLLALISLTAAIAQTPENPDDLYRTGQRLFADHKPDQALAALRRAAELRPTDAATWAAIGVVHASRADYPQAESAFHTACLLKPDLPDACLYYGRTLYLQDRFDDALRVLGLAAGREPEHAQIRRVTALCLEALGRAPEAELAFQQAIRFDRASPANDDPAIDYGVFLYRQGRAADALAPLEAALKRHPDAARAHLELGCVLLALDRSADAASHLERATALDPAAPRGHLLLGKAYQRLGKSDLAERELAQGSRTAR